MKRTACLFIAALFLNSFMVMHVGAISALELQMIRGQYPYYFNYEGCAPTTTGGGSSSITVGAQTFTLPAARGYTGYEAAIDENGKLLNTPNDEHVKYAKFAKLGQEYRDYYITMRWTTHKWRWNGDGVFADQKQEEWMSEKPRYVIVTNPRTNKSIIAAILEAGPAPWTGVDTSRNDIPKGRWQQPQLGTPPGYYGRVSGFPPKAIQELGAVQRDGGKQNGDELYYAWAPDQEESTPGPTTLSAAAPGPLATQCVPDSSLGGGAGVSPDGFVFPLRTTKERLKNNPYWSPRCKNSVARMGELGKTVRIQGLCHHDYLAADIQTPAGTKVLAPRPGRILRSGQSSDLCISHNLSLYSDPKLGGDGITYYFAHLNGEEKAVKDKIVAAGDVIGTVDEGHGCFQSHLHIDASPIQSSFRRNSSGTQGPLVDPQPALTASYENLPGQ